jgi:hypothetical protein
MAIIGVIEAELQASTRHESGGIGPLFKKNIVVAPFETGEFLSRTLTALGKIEGLTVANLFVDEEDLLAEEEEDEISVAAAQEIVDASFLDDADEFTVMCAYREGNLTYTVSAEGSREHDEGDPTLVVLASLVLPPWEEQGVYDEEEEPLEEGDELAPVEDDLTFVDEEDGPDYIAKMEALMQRLQREVDKELALADPDLRVWNEEVGDVSSPQRGVEWAG